MGDLTTRMSVLYRYFKFRFVFISLTVIMVAIILPLWVPYVPDFVPSQSLYSDQESGHSNLLTTLGVYDLDQNFDGTKEFDAYDLVVLINPSQDIPFSVVQSLYEATRRGTAFLLVGQTNIAIFGGHFDFSISPFAETDDRIFDPVNNGGGVQFPEFTYRGGSYYGVVPTSIEYFSFGEPIQTRDTAGYASCFDDNVPCRNSYSIGWVQPNFALIADKWMFSNQYTDVFASNIELFAVLVQDLIGESGSILFEESYLEWAPLNEPGVRNFIEIRLTTQLIAIVVFLFSFILPVFIGFQAKIFDRQSKLTIRSQEIEKRLDFLHLERLPAAPLNVLETILMNEKLQYTSRGKKFKQYVAGSLIQKLDTLEVEIPVSLRTELVQLSTGHYTSFSSWRVLEEGYSLLLSHYKNPR
ncbi:MAG: hypothetical protein ACXAE3_15890 [Candidatus Kariarchaeaceae archaeon]|jgi:hypothetical protein